mmetsp:Transcript_6773/g.9967  ORF Transcript_6773/g.9967 Transcript_6773/m.9967 type:complete len:322 (-) Transcript_6773:33-998(-)
MIGVDALLWIITFLQLNVGCEAFSLQTNRPSPQPGITKSTALSDTRHPLSSSSWSSKPKPFLAIITETDACDSKQRMEETYVAIKHALGEQNENDVDLISIRVICQEETDTNRMEFQERLIELTKSIMTLKEKDKDRRPELEYKSCMVVVNDHFEAAIAANADGVHVKEKDTDNIPFIKEQFTKLTCRHQKDIVIGTSAHSIESALANWKLYQPNYFFVGTCYLTQSHPEKDARDLEGPTLPGIIKRAIKEEEINVEEGSREKSSLDERRRQPIIFAIGGIGAENCNEPVELGADGVAVIRSVMQAENPGGMVSQMIATMS